MTDKTCTKCNGTGRLPWTTVDGGRCWDCTGKADTSYTRNLPTPEAFIAQYEARREVARAARHARIEAARGPA